MPVKLDADPGSPRHHPRLTEEIDAKVAQPGGAVLIDDIENEGGEGAAARGASAFGGADV